MHEELEKFEDAATQFKEERRKYFLYNIEILELVLSEMQMNSSDFFKFASSRDGQSTMKLLAALFSMCDDIRYCFEISLLILGMSDY